MQIVSLEEKSQILFSGKNKKNNFKMLSTEIFIQHAKWWYIATFKFCIEIHKNMFKGEKPKQADCFHSYPIECYLLYVYVERLKYVSKTNKQLSCSPSFN